MSSSTSPLVPTYEGLITTTLDALVLFEACLSGQLNHVPRRPHDKERSDLIRSGNIFIYEEASSGIKRWTDGITWSPSRILGNFLVYRELDQAFAPGEKKRALKKPASKRLSTGGITKPVLTTNNSGLSSTARLSISGGGGIPSSLSTSSSFDDTQMQAMPADDSPPGGTPNESSVTNGPIGDATRDPLRDLVGSLTDSYDFKENGLVKKTISIKYQGISHHLVSYYSLEDATSDKLMQPTKDPRVRDARIREELLYGQTFRAAISDTDYQTADGRVFSGGYMAIPHPMANQAMMGHVPPYSPAFDAYGHPAPAPVPHPQHTLMAMHYGNSYDTHPGFDMHSHAGSYVTTVQAAYTGHHNGGSEYTYNGQTDGEYSSNDVPHMPSFSTSGSSSVPDYTHHAIPSLDYAPQGSHVSHAPPSSSDFMPSLWTN